MLNDLATLAPTFFSSRGFAALLESFNMSESDREKDQEILNEANAAILELEAESRALFKVLKDQNSIRFPELATFELSSSQYAKTVLLLAGEGLKENFDYFSSDSAEVITSSSMGFDTSRLNSAGLPNATVMIISVTAATTKGRPLTAEEWKPIRSLARILIQMDRTRESVLRFIASRMDRIAPNVSALVGVEVASQLIGACGGIIQLSRVPAGNVQVIGSGGRKNLAGLSAASVGLHSGFIAVAPLVSEVAPEHRVKAQRLLSAKVSIASRVDSIGEHPDGGFGRKLYDDIVGKLEKLSEPAPLKSVKPLPIPDSERKKRRGGKRARKLKELYAQSEFSRQKNRLAFGETAEVEVIVGDEIEGMGMLGSANLRSISSSTADSKLRERLKKQAQGKLSTTGNSGMKSANLLAAGDNFITLPAIENKSEKININDNSNSSNNSINNSNINNSKYFNFNSGFRRNKD